jgi:hypothetical protein
MPQSRSRHVLLAEAEPPEVGRYRGRGGLKIESIVLPRIDAAAVLAIPRLPGFGGVGALIDIDHGHDG